MPVAEPGYTRDVTHAPTRLTVLPVTEAPDGGMSEAELTRLEDRISFIRDAVPQAIVLVNAHRDFCTGVNLAALPASPEGAFDVFSRYSRLLIALSALNMPLIAVVRGRAYGGGLGIAACADYVIADRSATFALPEALFGLIPAAALRPVAQRVGIARARAMAVSTLPVSATQAYASGLIDQISDDIDVDLSRLTRRLSRLSIQACASIKQMCRMEEIDAHAAAEAMRGLLRAPDTLTRLSRNANGEAAWGGGE